MSLNHLQGFLPQCPPSLPNLLDLGASHHGQMKCAPLGWVAPSLQIHPMTTQHSMKPPPDLLPRIRLKPKIMTGSLTWGRGPQVHLPPPAMHAAREVGLDAAKSSEPGCRTGTPSEFGNQAPPPWKRLVVPTLRQG
jgi:hypothetical protein